VRSGVRYGTHFFALNFPKEIVGWHIFSLVRPIYHINKNKCFSASGYLFRTRFEGGKTYETVKSEELVGATLVVARDAVNVKATLVVARDAVKVNGNQQLSRPVFSVEQGHPRGVPLRENKRKQFSFQRKHVNTAGLTPGKRPAHPISSIILKYSG
jgi:hypothetical protein